MKSFLKNIFTLLLIFSTINILILFFLLQTKFESKIKIFGSEQIDSAQILILGDSRADRQLNPKIIHSKTNLNVLNIAESSLDLYSLSLRLKEINLKNKIIIISASSWQINDGATDPGYFRIEAFNNLDAKQKLLLYYDRPSELIKMVTNGLSSRFDFTIGNKERTINNNFSNIKCKKFNTNGMLHNHPWYRNIKLNGVKMQLLKNALTALNEKNCRRIIIYSGPVYTEFIKQAKNNGVWQMENRYSEIISNFIITEKLNKITFLDLRNLSGFTQNDYYDPQHFCENGANKFTLKLIPILNKEITSSEINNNHQGST
jgi:hypothetical protein